MNDLQKIAARMKRDAKARAGVPVKHEFKNGAVVALLFDGSEFKLRIVRKGLHPKNDFSAKGVNRQRAWDTECETFRRAFGVPDNSVQRDDVQTVFYFRIYAWADVVRTKGNCDENVQARALGMGNPDARLADARDVGE